MKLKGLTLFLVFLCTVFVHTSAKDAVLKEELKAQVKAAKNPADSIKALYNLFDISPRKEQIPILRTIYQTADRNGDTPTRLDVLRHLANAYASNDSILQILYSTASDLPASVDQHQTAMYIRMNRILRNSMSASEAERQVRLREILQEYANKQHYSTDERILLLFSLCAYLSTTTEGELLAKYTEELEQLINSSPTIIPAIKNQFYSNAATLFTNIGDYDKAVHATRQLIKQTDELQDQYEKQGRIYRKFNRERFAMYRRMLVNYPALSLEEVDSIYNNAIRMTEINADAKRQYEKCRLTTIAWLMAHERYKEAAPLIQESLKKLENQSSYTSFLLKQLNIAAEHTDDKDLQLFAAREYNKHLEDYIKFKSEERLRELQVIYDLNKIRESNQSLELTNRENQIEAHQTIITISIVALIIVILITIGTFFMYIRAKQMSVAAIHAKQSLEHERAVTRRHFEEMKRSRNELSKANTQKSDLINSLGHEMRTPLTAISDFTKLIIDASDDTRKPYLNHFGQIITHNVELLEAISRDILDISILDGDEITISRKLTNPTVMCEMVVETLRQTTPSGVDMKFIQPEKETTLVTDPQRVEQILINLLNNSIRFTNSGEITLTYKVDTEAEKISFVVTDTGCGISHEQQKTIFERNPRKEHSSSGFGLYLCQIIATRLDGTLELDTEYSDGARFVLTLPL